MSNYTLGRGEIHFARYLPGTQTPEGERYIGNTPEFNLTISEEKLDHFSSDRGIKEKDDSISLQVTRSGSLTTDEISPENIALFFFGTAGLLSVSADRVADEAIVVKQGLTYQLGTSDSNPTGHRSIVFPGVVGVPADPGPEVIETLFKVTNATGETVYVSGTDYELDAELGRLTIIGSNIEDGDTIKVSYNYEAKTRSQVISGGTAIEGALRYIARNPKGENFDYYFPKVTISPNGDFALKSDEFQSIPFNIEILRKGSLEAIYLDGRPYTPA